MSEVGEQEGQGAVQRARDPSNVVVPVWAESFPCPCKFEVIKNGVQMQDIAIPRGGRSFVVGRCDKADAQIDYHILSRYHLMVTYGRGEEPEKNRSCRFWVSDLNTQNGTKLNKTALEASKFYPLSSGYVLQPGKSPYVLVFQASVDLGDQEESDHMPHLSVEPEPGSYMSSVIVDVVGRKGVAKPQAQESKCTIDTIKDHIKAVEGYFGRNGGEPEYEVSLAKDGPKNSYLACLSLNLYDEEGTELVAKASSASRSGAVEECAKAACRIINEYDFLFEKDIETAGKRKRRELEENDYYDSDEDTFLDRSGQIEKKRDARMARLGVCSVPAENYNTLNAKLDLIYKDMEDIKSRLSSSQVDPNKEADEDDSLDQYMKQLYSDIDERKHQEFRKRYEELEKEELRLKNLLKYCSAPDRFQRVEAKNMRVTETSGSSRFSTDAATIGSSASTKIVSPLKPGVVVLTTSEQDARRDLKKPNGSQKALDEKKRTIEKGSFVGNQQAVGRTTKVSEARKTVPSVYEDHEEKYDWVMPSDQVGDGRTALNDKLGY